MLIKHNQPTLGSDEAEAASRVVRSGFLLGGGEVRAFEHDLADYLGVDPLTIVAFSSGSAALYVLLKVLRFADRPVALPAYVCASILSAVRMAGCHPIFLDNRKDSPNIDYKTNQNIISHRCVAAIVPHMYGIPVDLKSRGEEFLIEDCAQSIGAKNGGQFVGLQGDASIFSFSATKLITSGGQGGAVRCKSHELAQSLRDYRDFDGRHDFELRFNFLMTEIQAAIGRVQLSKLPTFLIRREELFQLYVKSGFTLDGADSNDTSPVRYRAIIRSTEPRRIIQRLDEAKIRAIIPIEEDELLCPGATVPCAVQYAQSTVSLPLYPSLTDDQHSSVIESLKKCLS